MVRKFEQIHKEFIEWLNSKSEDYDIENYIRYVRKSLDYYDKYDSDKLITVLKRLPRSFNRALDEYEVDHDFNVAATNFFTRMQSAINE